MPTLVIPHAKTCTEPDCHRRHRARGLCSTHYNQKHQPDRHAATATTCTVCSTPLMRPRKADRRPTCSPTCRRTLQFGDAIHQHQYDWATDAVRRAEQAGVRIIDVFDRLQVFERDDWICHRCGERTDPTASVFDTHSPTVDHVIPLSKGGDHSLANARTACLGCNSSKQDKIERHDPA